MKESEESERSQTFSSIDRRRHRMDFEASPETQGTARAGADRLARERTVEFLENWRTPALSITNDCPLDSELSSIAKSGESDAHVENCNHCHTVVELLRTPEAAAGRRLQQFLMETRRLGDEAVASRRASFFRYLRAFFEGSWLRAAAVYAWIGLILLGGGWALLNRRSTQVESPQTLRLPADNYGMAIQVLHASIEQMRTETVSIDQTRATIAHIYELTGRDVGAAPPRQRAQLAALTAEYQKLIRQQYKKIPLSEELSTDDSRVVEALQQAYARSANIQPDTVRISEIKPQGKDGAERRLWLLRLENLTLQKHRRPLLLTLLALTPLALRPKSKENP